MDVDPKGVIAAGAAVVARAAVRGAAGSRDDRPRPAGASASRGAAAGPVSLLLMEWGTGGFDSPPAATVAGHPGGPAQSPVTPASPRREQTGRPPVPAGGFGARRALRRVDVSRTIDAAPGGRAVVAGDGGRADATSPAAP